MASVTPGYNHNQHGDRDEDESILGDDLIEADECKPFSPTFTPPLSHAILTGSTSHRGRRPITRNLRQSSSPRQHSIRPIVLQRPQLLRQLPHLLNPRRRPARHAEYHRRIRVADAVARSDRGMGKAAPGPLAQVPDWGYASAWRGRDWCRGARRSEWLWGWA